jgi:serine O-acetyltransferase
MWVFNKTKRTIQLPRNTKVGYGLYIGHGGPIVVNHTAVIGNNCNLSQFTTIGSNRGSAAIIGDNTYIGPNVCIVENVKIGNNVTIGAGSVVTKDIPDNATAVGNYAKVINYNEPGRFVHKRWLDID